MVSNVSSSFLTEGFLTWPGHVDKCFFFMLFYGRVVNMTSMSIIFYFEQVNECWQLPTLVAKGFRHLNSPKSTLKNFYNALLGSMSTNGVFLIARIWKYRFSEGILVKKFIFLKSLPSCSGRSWGCFNQFFRCFETPRSI